MSSLVEIGPMLLEEDENVKSLQTDDGRQAITKAHRSFQLR